jgi:DNA-binding response OmpR family regulator
VVPVQVESVISSQAAAGTVPVVVGIALDDESRRRLAAAFDGVGVVMFTPDVGTAHMMLSHQLPPAGTGNGRPSAAPMARLGELEVDQVRRRVTWQGRSLPLTEQERQLLTFMAAEPARVWIYRELYRAAWTGRYLNPGPVHATIKRLRRKLRQAGVPVRIEAARGLGYELINTQ